MAGVGKGASGGAAADGTLIVFLCFLVLIHSSFAYLDPSALCGGSTGGFAAFFGC